MHVALQRTPGATTAISQSFDKLTSVVDSDAMSTTGLGSNGSLSLPDQIDRYKDQKSYL